MYTGLVNDAFLEAGGEAGNHTVLTQFLHKALPVQILRYKLEDMIIIDLCTVICGEEDFADMESFGKSRQEYLAKFLELLNGIPETHSDVYLRKSNRSSFRHI